MTERSSVSAVEEQKARRFFELREAAADASKRANKSVLPFGAAKGKNVIVVQVESLQTFVIGMTVKGGEVTPNLNRLRTNCFYFDHFFSQTSIGATSDAEFCVFNSLLPARRGSTVYRYANNEFSALPEILQKHGYQTIAIVDCTRNVWNMARIHRRYGFAECYYNEYFKQRGVNREIGYDDELFSLSFELLNTAKRPFLAYFITISSHTPFDLFNPSVAPIDCGHLKGTTVGQYLEAVHFVDAAIGQFIERINASPFGQDCVLVIYGGHEGVSAEQRAAAGLGVESIERMIRGRVPLFLVVPGMSGLQQETSGILGGQIDLGPTLLDLLGIVGSEGCFLGESLFYSSRLPLVFFRSGDFLASNIHYSRRDDRFEPLDAKQLIPDRAACQALLRDVQERIWVSDTLLENDLIPKVVLRK
jgi:phosphoglycerol transferase MdoB-like AlkP superfamily enzyme